MQTNQLKKKLIAGLSLVAGVTILATIVVFLFPQLAASRCSYFDKNSGRLKTQWVSFGRVYQERVEETDYSKLLRSFGIEGPGEEWIAANTEELGLRRWVFPQQVSHPYGRIAGDAYQFALWVKFQKFNQERSKAETLKFHQLVQKSDPWDVKQYVIRLQQNATSK